MNDLNASDLSAPKGKTFMQKYSSILVVMAPIVGALVGGIILSAGDKHSEVEKAEKKKVRLAEIEAGKTAVLEQLRLNGCEVTVNEVSEFLYITIEATRKCVTDGITHVEYVKCEPASKDTKGGILCRVDN